MKSEIELKQMGYSDKAVGIILSNENIGRINNADINFIDIEDCGDVLTLYLKISGNKIVNASFEHEGCIGLQLAGTILTKMIKGLSLTDAVKIEFADILNYAERVPDDKQECIRFAIITLRKAISGYAKR